MTERVEALRLQLVATELGARIGARIRERREELRLNQRELADRMPPAVSNQTVSNWERGVNQPSQRYLELLAEALEVPVADFYREESRATPDLFPAGAADDQLGRVEAKLDALLERFEALATRAQAQRDEAIDRIEALERALTRTIAESVRASDDEWVDRVVTVVREAFQGDAQTPVSKRRTRAKSGSPRG